MAKTPTTEPTQPAKRKDEREAWTVRPTVPHLASTADPALAAVLQSRTNQYEALFNAIRNVPVKERNQYMLRLMLQGYLSEQPGTVPPAPPVEWAPLVEPPAQPKSPTKGRKAKQLVAPPPPESPAEDDPTLAELG